MREATLISTGDRPVLRFERFLPRPVEEVWHAVTDPAEMRAWFPTRIESDRWEAGAGRPPRSEYARRGGGGDPAPPLGRPASRSAAREGHRVLRASSARVHLG